MKSSTFSAAPWISGAVSEDAEHHDTEQELRAGWLGRLWALTWGCLKSSCILDAPVLWWLGVLKSADFMLKWTAGAVPVLLGENAATLE